MHCYAIMVKSNKLKFMFEKKENKVFIATSMDGFIADINGGIAWLDTIPEINTIDTGYASFMKDIDALVMGRNSYEKVLSFGIDWPYKKPVYVLSNTLKEIDKYLQEKVEIIKGDLLQVLDHIHANGHHRLYIDGGNVIQSFLKEDLIDEMTITIIPILLGEGIPLFSHMKNTVEFRCTSSKLFLDSIVQNHFKRLSKL